MPVTSHGGPQTVPTGNGANDENDESNYDGDGDVDGESDGEDEEVDEDADEGISDECSDDELVPLATVQNPSRDVRGDLERTFRKNLEFQGSYCASKVHTSAPIPGLQIEGLGRVGLPLSERDAKDVILRCTRAPFGEGERTTTARDTDIHTWEIDSSKVSLDGPQWPTFVKTGVADVCEALGVRLELGQPRHELCKLVLYEAGSLSPASEETETPPGMFATMNILLPSEFSGGSLHLSHSGSATIFDNNATSAFTTSIIAWHAGVQHEVKPVTSGYRLALSYKLFHTNLLQPSLSTSLESIKRLRHVLLSWQQTLAVAPKKIVYLLEHVYSKFLLGKRSLRGSDAHLVRILQSLADECQIQLGLVSVKYYVKGAALMNTGQYPDPDDDYGFSCDYDVSDSDSGSDNAQEALPMGSILERRVEVQELVDLDGNELLEEFEGAENGSETIPRDMREHLKSVSPNKQRYKENRYARGCTVEQWYRRTLLVIWPFKREEDILGGESLEDRMIKLMEAVETGDRPSREELAARDFLMGVPQQSETHGSVARAVCHAAAQWEDAKLWARAFTEFGGGTSVERLGTTVFTSSLARLGPEFVLPYLHEALDAESDDSKRLACLDKMEESIRNAGQSDLLEVILGAKSRVLQSLRLLKHSSPSIALPNLAKIAALAQQYRISATHPIFASFYKTVILAWCRDSLKDTPECVEQLLEGVLGIRCSCEHCPQVVAFFKNSKASLSISNIAASAVTHLEQTFSCAENAAKVAKWRTVGRRTFTINKLWAVIQAAVHKEKQTEGINYLKQISAEEAVLRRIFDNDYTVLCHRLGTRWINHELPPMRSQNIEVQHQPESRSAPQSGKSPRPPEDALQPPRKRQKTGQQGREVADLTSP